MQKTERTLRQNIDRLMEMLDPAFDWEAYYEGDDTDDPDDIFRSCVQVGYPKDAEESKKYVECGSSEVEDTPKALYRLLFLLKPEKLDFNYMYKGSWIGFFSADKRFFVDVHFFKYEIGLYFYAPKETIKGKGSFVLAGAPGADNGWRCDDPDGVAFFAMVVKAVNSPWNVYPGNDFTV